MNPPLITDLETTPAANSPGSPYQDQADGGPEAMITSPIWTEVGFFPPVICREAVELLHRLAMEEDETAERDSATLIIRMAMQMLNLPESRFSITNPQKIEDIATEYGVAIAGRDVRTIARDVTAMIIADYDRRPTTPTETTP